MLITISGVPGSGKSTVAGIVALRLKYRHYSIGNLLRKLAEKKCISLLEISKLAETDKSVDDYLDSEVKALGKKDNVVVDARLGFHFLPNSFKVFLEAKPEEAGKRIFADKRPVERENSSLKATIENIKKRKESEKLRYRKLYGINPYEEDNYDLIVDTTMLSPSEVAEQIISAANKQGKKQ